MIEPLPQSFSGLSMDSHHYRSGKNKKTSLGYILGPSSPESPSIGSTTSSSRPSSSSSNSPLNFCRLPRQLISRIAFIVVVSPVSSDSGTAKADSHPADLLPLLLTCKGIYAALSFTTNPRLYRDLYLVTFDTEAITRRYAWISATLEKQSGGKKKAFDLFGDPKSYAHDYKARWACRQRMRRAIREGTVNLEVGVKADCLPDLWVIWFLVTESGQSPFDSIRIILIVQMARTSVS